MQWKHPKQIYTFGYLPRYSLNFQELRKYTLWLHNLWLRRAFRLILSSSVFWVVFVGIHFGIRFNVRFFSYINSCSSLTYSCCIHLFEVATFFTLVSILVFSFCWMMDWWVMLSGCSAFKHMGTHLQFQAFIQLAPETWWYFQPPTGRVPG